MPEKGKRIFMELSENDRPLKYYKSNEIAT